MQPLGETSNTPAFLGKLWKMVNDPSTDPLICWSPSGTSFIIQNQAQFWYELLPLYYKHNNMSSFVRQLNMYGFHKLSTVENGTMDTDKDEIKFTHQFFRKGEPDLLRNIKRKATTAKTVTENVEKHDELSKILDDVKQLRGRQVTVDSTIHNMRKENALLWRELSILRQKHVKQQKIVNKLIQFLVTLVQPTRMTVGVNKRGYQLMLNESPTKKVKTNINKNNTVQEGPTIHELDSELELPSTIYENEPVISSPTSAHAQVDLNSPLETQWLNEENVDDPDYYAKTEFDLRPDNTNGLNLKCINLNESNSVDTDLIDTLNADGSSMKSTTSNTSGGNENFFLHSSGQDTLLSGLMNTDTVKEKNKNDSIDALTNEKSLLSDTNSNMAIATINKNLRDISKSVPSTSNPYNDGLINHVEATQNELDQLKDILNGYNTFVDANALLGLFHGESSAFDLEGRTDDLIDSDLLVSGSELAPYGPNFDFNELLDESLDGVEDSDVLPTIETSSTINTPLVTKDEPIFPKKQ